MDIPDPLRRHQATALLTDFDARSNAGDHRGAASTGARAFDVVAAGVGEGDPLLAEIATGRGSCRHPWWR